MKKITIGARGSKLSLAYVAKVKDLLLKKNLNLREDEISTKVIQTSGDIFYDNKLSEIGGKNLFCKEIEENLLNKKIDIAVHSLKDMESEENDNLTIGAYIKRNDPRDVFISIKYKTLKELKKDSTVGSSSRRRSLQLKLINPNIIISNIRGNIDTRIKKLEEGKFDAIILAAGKGERLRPLTENKPKCLVKLFGKSILEWQIESFQNLGITDITVVTGYLSHLINFPSVKIVKNTHVI